MATIASIAQTPDPETDKPNDLESLLADWEPYAHQLSVKAGRYSPDGKVPIVGTLTFDATIEDIKRAWGGGKYRFMVTAREAFTGPTKRHTRGSIVGQVTEEVEGEPITRLAGNLTAALREADESPRGQLPPAPPLPQLPPGGGDMSMVGLAFQSMMESNRVMAERAAAQQAETRDLFMAMMQSQRRDSDPFETFDRILDIQAKLGGAGEPSMGSALMAALPQLGQAVEKILAKLPDKAEPKNPPHELRLAGTERSQAPEPTPASRPAQHNTEKRLVLALQTLAACVTDPEMDPAAAAHVIACVVGSDTALAMAQEPSTVDQLIEYAPSLVDHREAIEAVHRELASMFEPDDAGGTDGDSESAQA